MVGQGVAATPANAVTEQDATDLDSDGLYTQLNSSSSPTVTTQNATSVTEFRSTLNGQVEPVDADSAYFEWRVDGADTWTQTQELDVSEEGEFSTELSELDDDTTYEFRAVAEFDGNRTVGDTLTFVTAENQFAEDAFIRPDADTEIFLWERFIFPFRANPSTQNGTEVTSAITEVNVPSLDTGTVPLDKSEMAVYDESDSIELNFQTTTGADTSQFNNTQVDLLAVESDFTADDDFSQVTRFETLMESNETTAQIAATTELDGDGEASFSFDPSAAQGAGDYVFFVVNSGSVTVENEDVTQFTNTRILGMDFATVQDTSSSVSTNRPEYRPGEIVEVDAEANFQDEQITQAVVLYNEAGEDNSLGGQAVTFVVNGELDDVSAEDISVETTFEGVDGVRRSGDGVLIRGKSVEERNEVGLFEVADIFSFIGDQIGTDLDTETGDIVLNASMVAQGDTGPQTTFEIETLENFTAGEYSVVHIAEGDETGQVSTNKETVRIDETLTDYITVDIDEETTDTQVASGEMVTVNATVQNIGDNEADREFIDFEVDGEREDDTSVTLEPGESQAVTFEYSNTDSSDELNVRVNAAGYERSDSEDSITIDIVDDAFYDVDINEANSTLDVVEGETAAVNTTIENTVDLPGSQTVNLTVDGEVVDQQSIELDGKEVTTVDFEWVTEDGDAGEFEAVVDSEDDSASTNVTVREPAFFDVTNLDPESLTVENGSELDVSADITNTGGANVTQDVELRFDDTTVDTRSVTLGPDNRTTVMFEGVPITETGEFTHGVYSDDANATGALTVVEEFETTIDVSLVGPDPAREQTSATYDISADITNDAGEETIENITVDFGDDSVDLSDVGSNDVTVQILGDDLPGVTVVDQGDTLRLDLSNTVQVTSIDGISITAENVVNPVGGTYDLEVSLIEADSRFATDSVEYTTETADDAVAAIEADPTDPDVNVTAVEFNASASQGAGDLQYEWDFTGDGEIDETTQEPVTTHTYTVSDLGEYDASVRIVDELNENDTASVTIDVGDTVPPNASLVGPDVVSIDTEFELDASDSTDNHRIDDYTWEITENETDETVFQNTTTDATIQTEIEEPGNYTVSVTVADESGNTDTASVGLLVEDLPNLVADVDAPDKQRLQDGVTATANVSNTGTQPAETAFDWNFTATGVPKGADDPVTFSREGTIQPNFEPGALETVSDNFEDDLEDWAETNEVVGQVELELEVDGGDTDGAVRETITQDNVDTAETRVTYVELNAEAAVRDTIVQGSNATLRSFVRNIGTAANDPTSGSIIVENESDEEVLNESLDIGAIGPRDRQRNRTATDFVDTGEHNLTVVINDERLVFDGKLEDTKSFDVEPYELTINEARTRVPGEVRRGERFTVGLAYETNARDDVNVSVDLPEELSLAAGQAESRTVDGRSDRVNFVRWTVVADDPGEHEVSFSTEDTRDLSVTDTYSENVTVPRNWESVSNTSSVRITDDNDDGEVYTESFVWNQTTDEHNLTISAQAGSDGRTLQGLEYLVRYPYGCVEQTTSAFLGALNTHQYYEDRDDYEIDDNRQDRINNSIERGVERLADGGARGQRSDGGWNMWGSGSNSDTFFSAYALYGLSQVENDETYRNQTEGDLDNVDFDAAVGWLNDEGQNDDGSFDARYYIRDDVAMTGFTVVSLNETTQHDRIDDSTSENITDIYANASRYLIEQQEEDGSWSDGDGRATGLAVWALQISMDAGVHEEHDDLDEGEMRAAINNGTASLIDSQAEDGRWEASDSPYWNLRGENSRHTGYVLLALDSVDADELDDVNEADITNATDGGADYLMSVYESRGSWGYPRSTVIALEALTQVTNVPADRTVQIEIANSSNPGDPVVNKTITVDADDTPEGQIEFTLEDDDSVLEQLRNADEQVHTVTVTDVSDGQPSEGTGTVIVAIENDQVVDGDELGGDDE